MFDTISCAGKVQPDDTQIPISGVSYNKDAFTSTVVFSKLGAGNYRLFVCASTTIHDLAGNPINGGNDYILDFSVQKTKSQENEDDEEEEAAQHCRRQASLTARYPYYPNKPQARLTHPANWCLNPRHWGLRQPS